MKWIVRHKWKLINPLIVTFTLGGAGIIYWIVNSIAESDDNTISLVEIYIMLFFLFFGGIIYISGFFGKRVPKHIEIIEENNTISFNFGKKKKTFSLDLLSYSGLEEDGFYALTFYLKYHSRRGHIVHREYLSVVGNRLGIGWSKSKLKSIERYLEKLDVEIHYPFHQENIHDKMME